MAIKTTMDEHKFLVSVDDDFAKYGESEKRCPRCGNEIEVIEVGKSYTVKCKTKNCISADFRGI